MAAVNADKNNNYAQIQRTAYLYAVRRGLPPEQAEDFAQDVCIARFNGRNQPLRHHFADHARMWKVRGGGYVDSVEEHPFIYDKKNLEDAWTWHMIEKWPITKIERVIVLLLVRFNLAKEDVAYLLSVSPARITQMTNAIKLRMSGNKVANV